MQNLSLKDSDNGEFRKAFRVCFNNREELENEINEVHYSLSELSGATTMKDIFLEKEGGGRCATLLVQQVRFQHDLMKHIAQSGDIERMLMEFGDQFNNDWACCLRYLLSTSGAQHDVEVSHQESVVHIYFQKTEMRISCHSLVHFTDKLLQFITQKLQTLSQNSFCRTLLDDDMKETIQAATLMKDIFDELSSGHLDQAAGEPDQAQMGDELPRQESAKDGYEAVGFDERAPSESLEEVYSYSGFKMLVLSKYCNLEKHYEDNYASLKVHDVVILYTNHNSVTSVANCTTIAEAIVKANTLEDILKETFQVVLISSTENKSPRLISRKRMIQKMSSSSKVGQEVTPSILGTLQTPKGKDPSFDATLLFYIDTGADSGSVGYNYHVIKNFILTVEIINGSEEPAVLCNFHSEKITAEEVQVFDVDEQSDWNAIGLSVLKNYRIYLDIKNNIVEVGLHEDVTVNETEDTFAVSFKKIALSGSFPEHIVALDPTTPDVAVEISQSENHTDVHLL